MQVNSKIQYSKPKQYSNINTQIVYWDLKVGNSLEFEICNLGFAASL